MSIFKGADILIPKNIDMKKWSVVACDQYTSQREYWERVKSFIKDAPSSFNLIFPEAYFSEVDFDRKIADINLCMKKYLDEGIFKEYKNTLIFVKRTFSSGAVRHGIIGAVDLEEYDFKPDSTSFVRATEKTVEDRLPPRIAIRKNASLELPHILMLIDDKNDSVMGRLKNNPGEKIYDFDLMEDGGHIEGYIPHCCNDILNNIDALKTSPLLAVGDGNHSLAAAKCIWEELKKDIPEAFRAEHPKRYALCELVNLYEPSLVFEPIYRVFFGCIPEKLLKCAESSVGKYLYNVNFVSGEKSGTLSLRSDCHVESGAVTEFLENYQKTEGGRIDYIHGKETASKMGFENGNIAFLVNCLKKEELFSTVNQFGPLPKKTFSMGNAEEKRFYVEARKLVR